MNDPLVLALETATDICSVAIMKGANILALQEEKGYIHSSKLAVFIKDALTKAEVTPTKLDAVAVSIGPGSYTGLRVGLSTAKAICFVHDIPLITVPTNEGFAKQSRDEHKKENAIYLPMVDARRMEVYVAAYDVRMNQKLSVHPLILTPEWFEQWKGYNPIILSGDGSNKVRKLEGLPSNIIYSCTKTSARYIGEIAYERFKEKDFQDIAYIEPDYIKPANVTRSKKKLL